MIEQASVTTLNASTFEPIKIPRGEGVPAPVSYYTDDGSAFYVATNSAGTGAWLVPANTIFSRNIEKERDGTIMYVKASSGAPNFNVELGRR